MSYNYVWHYVAVDVIIRVKGINCPNFSTTLPKKSRLLSPFSNNLANCEFLKGEINLVSKYAKVVGHRINTLLAEQDIKQSELAEKLGIVSSTVSCFVSGTRMPNTEQLVKIADFLMCQQTICSVVRELRRRIETKHSCVIGSKLMSKQSNSLSHTRICRSYLTTVTIGKNSFHICDIRAEITSTISTRIWGRFCAQSAWRKYSAAAPLKMYCSIPWMPLSSM